MDTQEREILAELGFTDATLDGIDLFESVTRPDDDTFHNDAVCDPITLTAGQVWRLRGALRFQMTAIKEGVGMVLAGLAVPPDDWNDGIGGVLGLDNLLAEAYGACVSQDVQVPDEIPDDFAV